MSRNISKSVAQQIVNTVKDVCGQDINFIDQNGYIFASTNEKRIGDYHEIGRQCIVQEVAIEVECDNSFLGTNKGVNIPFVYKGDIIAAIGISGAPEEVRKYAYLAQKITTLILREHELDIKNNNKREQLNYIIRSLVSNIYIEKEYLYDFFEKNQINKDTKYQTIIIRLDARYHPSNLSLVEQKIFQTFDIIGSKLYTFQYPNEYVLLLETKLRKQWMYLFRKMAEQYKGLLKIGIGSSNELEKQSLSYEAAKIAISSIRSIHNIVVFEELDLEILYGEIPQNRKEHFSKKILGSLEEEEYHLLSIYFSNDMSLKKTCEELFLHKNTLQYKLDRIWNKSGYNPRSFRDAAVLYTALSIAK